MQPHKHRKAIYYGDTSVPTTLRAEPHDAETGSTYSVTNSVLSDQVQKKFEAMEEKLEKICDPVSNDSGIREYVDDSIAKMEKKNAQ